jgi:hypothetical protein
MQEKVLKISSILPINIDYMPKLEFSLAAELLGVNNGNGRKS